MEINLCRWKRTAMVSIIDLINQLLEINVNYGLILKYTSYGLVLEYYFLLTCCHLDLKKDEMSDNKKK